MDLASISPNLAGISHRTMSLPTKDSEFVRLKPAAKKREA